MRNTSLNLLVISNEFPPGPGGLGTLAYQVSHWMTKFGWKVQVATLQSFCTDQEIETFNKGQLFKITRFNYVGPAFVEGNCRLYVILQLIRSQRPDVILAVGLQSVLMGSLVSVLTRIPLVAVGAGSEFVLPKRILRVLTRWAYHQVDLIVFISKYSRKLAESHGFSFINKTIITPGADEEIYKPGLSSINLSRRLKLTDQRVILTVGRVSRRKAHDVIIKALPNLVEDFPQVHFLIVGLPENQTSLEKLAMELGVIDHIQFAGYVSQVDLPVLYNLAEIFVLVSRFIKNGEVEGFGMVVIEAALCGKPAIVSNNTGLEEAVIHEVTGLVVEQDNPEMTAYAIKRLLANEKLRIDMGKAARKNALKKATWKQQVKQYEIHIKNIIQAN